jgi:positive regulator of sigma E activity
MVFGNFEQGGIIAMLGGVLALVVSYVLVRRFNKEIREQKQRHKSV